MKEVNWGEKPSDPEARKIGLSKPSPEALEKLSGKHISRDRSFVARRHGPIDQTTLESMAVAVFLRGKNDEKLERAMRIEREKEAEQLVSSEVRGEYFENAFLGTAFDALRDLYIQDRQLIGFSDAGILGTGSGQDANEVEMYKDELHQCYATLLIRQVRVNVIIKQMVRRFRGRTADRLFQKYQKDRKDPKVGPDKSLDNFRNAVICGLGNQGEEAIQEYDWIEDYQESMSRLIDMKRNPEKYTGFKCGIGPIDEKTKGFRPGHLTVFVGKHGGFKSTMMINIAFGLWKRGYNVLYASLEMEAELMEMKLWCRATQQVSFERLYAGQITEVDDWKNIEAIRSQMEDSDLSEGARHDLGLKLERLKSCVNSLDRVLKQGGKKGEIEDTVLIRNFYEERRAAKNRLKIINVGQSNKIKPSQIERWLKENESKFKPQVVLVDYLDLVAPESPYKDRRDLELGDICKYLRQMGKRRSFAVITAAQFKRAAVDRIRKAGLKTIDKAHVGTDDIAGSDQIGADADEVFMLFRDDGGNRLLMLTPKARHGIPDTEKGAILQVKPDNCLIAGDDFIEDTSIRASRITVQQGLNRLGSIRAYVDRPKTPDDDDFSYLSDAPLSGNDDMDNDLMEDLTDQRFKPTITPSDASKHEDDI